MRLLKVWTIHLWIRPVGLVAMVTRATVAMWASIQGVSAASQLPLSPIFHFVIIQQQERGWDKCQAPQLTSEGGLCGPEEAPEAR